jgi:hypothetical protein
MEQPGNKDIQFALQASYGSNLQHYEEWHAYFRKHVRAFLQEHVAPGGG